MLDCHVVVIPGSVDDEEEELLRSVNAWMATVALPAGEYRYELSSEGKLTATLDLAWPAGVQEGLGQPVALLLGEGEEIQDIANQAGYRFFTTVEAFKAYVVREVLAEPDETSQGASAADVQSV